MALQSPKPAPQTNPQLEPAQTGIALLPATQGIAQPPQFSGSLVVSRQLPEQSLRPVPHDATQAPDEQTVPSAHAMPQLPQ
jgi:hypothetical protein